jgi:hypothetical protein
MLACGLTALTRAPPAPSVTLTTTETTSQISALAFEPISQLCESLAKLTTDGSCCGYLVDEDRRYYIYSTSGPHVNHTSVTLAQILQGDIQPRPTRRQRYAVSLILASSFLQLLDSPWLSTAFDKSEICFLSDSSDPNVLLLDEPHVTRAFESMCAPKASGQATKPPSDAFRDALDRLGILLLELCFGSTLQSQPCRKRWPEGDDELQRACFDVMAARNWQCEVNEEAGEDYSEAVAWCLGGNRSAPPDRWRQDMMKKVVQPLQRCRDYLIAGMP